MDHSEAKRLLVDEDVSEGERTLTSVTAHRFLPLVLALLLGVGLSFTAFFAVRAWQSQTEVRVAEMAFQARAVERTDALRREFDHGLDAIRDLAAFLRVTNTPEALQRFAPHALAMQPAVHGLAWVPQVAGAKRSAVEARLGRLQADWRIRDLVDGRPDIAAERPAYLPVLFLAAYSLQTLPAGLDLALLPAYRDALDRARDTGQLAATAPLPHLPGSAPAYDVAAVLPVYRGGAVPTTLYERRNALDGFVLGTFRLDKLVARASLRGDLLGIEVTDETGSQSVSLYRSDSFSDDGQVLRRSFALGGRTWTVAASERRTGAQVGETPLVVLGAGLTVTLLFLWYMGALRLQAGALFDTNAALSVEVEERRRTEVALRESESRFRKILESAADAILIIDSGSRITIANRQAETLFGYPLPQLKAMSVHDLVPDALRERHRAHHAAYLAAPDQFRMPQGRERLALRGDGSTVPVEINLSLMRTADGPVVTAIVRDVSERKRAEAFIEWLARFPGENPNPVLRLDGDANILYANQAAEPLVAEWRRDTGGSLPAPLAAECIDALRTGRKHEMEWSFGSDDYVLTFSPAPDASYVNLYALDITARREAEQTRERLSAVLEATTDFVGIADGGGHVKYVNGAGRRLSGLGDRSLERCRIEDFVAPASLALLKRQAFESALRDGTWEGELLFNGADGAPIPTSAVIVAQQGAGGLFFACVARDISERKRYEEELDYQAQHDQLTGLPNRVLLQDRLDQTLVYAERYKRPVAVLFFGLDRFRLVNDSLGHALGDALLQVTARRLLACARPGDTVARYGGDEFVLVVSDLARAEEVNGVAERAAAALAEPVDLDGHRLQLTVSIGVTLFPRDGTDSATLLRNADAAVNRSKELGRNTIHFYTEDLNARLLERLNLERQLRSAVAHGELELFYQPQLDLRQGRIVGFEALLRWRHPELGLVSPIRFIPLAEETGLILPIGNWVLETACRQARAWQAAGLPPVCVAVNLSARQLAQSELEGTIRRVLRDTGLDPRWLELELTETAVMEDPSDMSVRLARLKATGVQISIDDFGTGYSSLSHLKRFPFDKLKIDRSFVRDITTDEDAAAIARTMIGMAHSLRLHVVAEGVETEAQLRYLMRNGCDEVQGFHFSPPVPVTAAEAMLREGRRLALPAVGYQRVLLLLGSGRELNDTVRRLAAQFGSQLVATTDLEEACDLLDRHEVTAVLADARLNGVQAAALLGRVHDLYPAAGRIVLVGRRQRHETMSADAALPEPWTEERLADALDQACAAAQARQ